MQTKRPADERGKASFGWLDSKHSFSFGHYNDPRHMGFGPLRVINEDRVAPAKGFDTHGHKDMEIISYVIDGALEHQDSMGTGSVIRPGNVQRMSAGTGVQHSEFNHSHTDPVHFLQIWVIPSEQGIEPGYEEMFVSDDEKRDQLRLIASGQRQDGALMIHQDADIYASQLRTGKKVTHSFATGRLGWIQLISGEVHANDEPLSAGDGLALQDEPSVSVTATADAEFLLFDMTP